MMIHFTSSQETFKECQCGLPHVLRHPMLRVLPDPLHLEALGAFKPASNDATCPCRGEHAPNCPNLSPLEPLFMLRCMGDGSNLVREGFGSRLPCFSKERAASPSTDSCRSRPTPSCKYGRQHP